MTKLVTRIHCIGLMGQLGKEIVTGYEADNKTVSAIIDDLLDCQVLPHPIIKGTIDASIANLTRSIKVDGITILNTILKLRETVGGFIDVDNDRKFTWRVSIGEDKGQQIRYKKNLKGIEREIDYSSLANRIYAYGQGEGDARIKLSQAEGQTEDYVEDTDSQTEWGGIYTRVFVDKTITHPETLLAWANQLLLAYKNPPTTYRVDTLDLSKRTDKNFSFEKLQLGSTIKVIDEDLGIDVQTRAVRIRHPDLNGKPGYMQVELSTKSRDIGDLLANVYDTQQLSQRSAVQIGAGQVTVLGTFKVSDWLNEGETTICGDNIRSGVLQSNNWGASAGSYFDLTAGTFKLGGSSAPKLEWDGTNLTVRGVIYATSGEFTGTLKVCNIESGKTLTVNGTISAGGENVKISPTGINIFGLANGLTTRATEAGTIQCCVGSNGAFYAGAGKVKLDSTGLDIGSTGEGTAHILIRREDGIPTGSLWANMAGLNILAAYGNLILKSNTQGIDMNAFWMDLPTKPSHPTAVLGRLYYNTTDNHLYLYRGSWVAID